MHLFKYDMAYHTDLSVRQNRCFMQFDELHLKCYIPEEVRHISVVEVDQVKTFDEAGFPIRGGLYDPRLGADDDTVCETCGMAIIICPGHFGHIQLTVPVFNPLLFSFTMSLMKGTCIHCHRFTFDSNSPVAKIAIGKIRALTFGVSEILGGIEGEIKQGIEQSDLIGERIEILGELTFLEEIDKIIAKLAGFETVDQLRDQTKTTIRHQTQLKNNLVKRNEIIKNEFLRKHLYKRKVRCPRCKRANGELRNDSGQAFLLDFNKQTKIIQADLNQKFSFKNMNIDDDIQRPDLGYGGMELEDELDMKKFDPNSTFRGPTGAASSNIKPSGLLDPLTLSNQLLAEQLEQIVLGKCDKLAWRAAEVREHLRLLWEHEGILMRQIFPLFDEVKTGNDSPSAKNGEQIQDSQQKRSPIDVLFIETLMVEPSRFRPIRFLRGDRYEHPTTVNLRRLLEANQLLALIKMHLQTEQQGPLPEGQIQMGVTAKELIDTRIQGKTTNEKLHNAYLELQMRANGLFDQKAIRGADANHNYPGLKQVLEKKEGLFRMHMMGKRVNYACRSVITPDPYLDIDEIGIPEIFARRLTFPEPISYLNLVHMRNLVRRGPLVHPGANFVEQAGKLGKKPLKVKLGEGAVAANERAFQSTRLSAGDTDNVHTMPDTVLRHLQNGDHLLMNRQPSLHKPSIMGHRARVLRGQKALRMNYAPCKAYNADFDGDEMNGHFVQNRVAQCEAAELANVGSNFLVPKDGTPILGLIQDHVVSGVLMTVRGRFFNKEDYMHLVLSAFAETAHRIKIPPPAILWPKRLWSGKQVITAIVQNCCPVDKPYINLTGKAKTSVNCWKARDPETGQHMPAPPMEMSESEVIFSQGELLCGVLDKAHYGATQFGLIHCCFELYGPRVAVQLLSCFSRVFTTYLQFHAFSLGVADILVQKSADKQRHRIIRQLRKCGEDVVKKTFGLPDETPTNKIRHALATAYNHPRDREIVKMIDYSMKQAINKYAEQINNICVPSGLIRDFPQNALQLMIQSGAKGSLVNSIQISSALGQIELEGKRPPLSVTGRSLPSFRAFDPSPRAGGFIEQRFLTGINPQELFFHTMAGREGLIDTAVKTSRSGYLQRCIIKHLEGITIRYDHTVRDYDNSIIQFRYGEDGLDVGRSTFINAKQFPFLYENSKALAEMIIPTSTNGQEEMEKWHLTDTQKHYKKISKFKRRQMRQRQANADDASENPQPKQQLQMANISKGHRFSAFNNFHEKTDTAYLLKETIVNDWKQMKPEERKQFEPEKVPLPVDVIFQPTTNLGALPENTLDQLNSFIKNLKNDDHSDLFKRAIYWKGLRAFADPGECVGLLAAQSIGEPSTQMTLNTFHFAGRGEMNVTLGIPRLREILMTQSKNIATPIAEICIRPEVTHEQVEQLKSELNPVDLRQLLRCYKLEERIILDAGTGKCFRAYELRLELLNTGKRDPAVRHLRRRQILREIERRFGNGLATLLKKLYKEVTDHRQLQHKKLRAGNFNMVDQNNLGNKKRTDEDMASDEEDAIMALNGEGDADEIRLNKRHLDDAAEYEGEEEDRDDSGLPDEEDNNVEIGQDDDDDDIEEVDSEIEGRIAGQDNKEDAEGDIKPKRQSHGEIAERIETATKNPLITEYTFDIEMDRWCQFVFAMPQNNQGMIDVHALVDREVERFIVSRVPGVEKCVVREEQRNGCMTRILQTQGINKEAFYSRSRFLDVNTIYSNDINWIWENYGIEATTRTIVKEMNNVFGVYGIEVNPRHLTLTADYMTFTGIVLAFNRGAMEQSASPLQKMTFETTVNFMQKAIVGGESDPLFSPSARIVLGQLIRGGTGAICDLLTKPEYALNLNANKVAKPTSKIGEQISEMRNKRRRRKMDIYQQ